MPVADDHDLNEFPSDVDVPSSLTAEQSGQLDTGETLLQFEFCIMFNGRAWFTVPVAAPSPQLAALTVDQYVRQILNPALERLR
jgi:hypothetical protein